MKDRIAAAHGTQCGFCTPGMVMSMYTLLRNSPTPSLKQIEGAFEGKTKGAFEDKIEDVFEVRCGCL